MADWGALYLQRDLGISDAVGVFGFAAFCTCMAVGRFSAGWILKFISPDVLVRSAALVASIGLAAGLLINKPSIVVIAFGLVGLGVSVMVPQAFSAIGLHDEIPRGRALASVATIGYCGFVFGPPILGWFAELTSLRLSLALISLAVVTVVFLASSLAGPRSGASSIEAESNGR